MPKASPLIRSFNAGEFSPLMEGRTDIDRYNAASRRLMNTVATPQGPRIGRSGTAFMAEAYDSAKESWLIPFVFDDEDETDSFVIEMADQRARWFTEDGVLVRTARSMNVLDDSPFFRFTSADLTADGAGVGSQVSFSNFPASYNLNGVVANITAKSGDDYTVDIELQGAIIHTGKASLVYHEAHVYTEAQVSQIRELQSLDTVYLFHPDVKPYKLIRSDTYDWDFTPLDFKDGPYMDVNITAYTMALSGTTGSVDVTLSDQAAINDGQGWLATDVGRLIRFKDPANNWTWLQITARTSATVAVATIRGADASAGTATVNWRLGYYSDTTGWPTCGGFYQDRLWLGGSKIRPDLVAGSVTGLYDEFDQSDPNGTVQDTSAIVVLLNSPKLSGVKWLAEGDRGLFVGTGSQEYVIAPIDGANKKITPTTAIKYNAGSRGSYNSEPISFGTHMLFTKRFGRALHELAFVFETDGYKSPSMSSLASHHGISPFKRLQYAQEPFSIVWVLRDDGALKGMTYNRDENVVGWHSHDFQGGIVESIAVKPSVVERQDALWLMIRRTINGQTKRYVEKLTRFWDFDMTIPDAHYVDCAIRYSGEATSILYGYQHLEGETVYGIADEKIVGPIVVTEGAVDFGDEEYEEVILGLGFESDGETMSLENGAADGTAIGKVKRMNLFTAGVWASYGGELGTWNEDKQEVEWVPLDDYFQPDTDEVETPKLFTGIVGPYTPAPGYEKKGSVFFRRKADCPLPFNLTSIMPQLHTQDR